MALRLKTLISSGSKKGPRINYPFFLKKSRQANPLHVPQWSPYGERYPLVGHFYISLSISLIVFLSESSVRERPPCSLTGSPQTGVLRHKSHWPSRGFYLFIHLFIHVCLSESPKRSSPTYIQEKHKVTVHGAPRSRKAYIQWGETWFPERIVNDAAICKPVSCSLRRDTFHLGLGRPEPR
jgi:hypothetical protein